MRTSERRQLKQDRFAQATTGLLTGAVEHRAELIRTGIFAAIVVALLVTCWFYWTYRNEQAQFALGKAIQTYGAPLVPANTSAEEISGPSFATALERTRAANKEFEEVARRFRFTKPGQTARYMAALTAVDMGNRADGERELKNVADSGDRDLASLAKLALAGLYRDAGKNKEALDLFQSLVSHPSNAVTKERAQLELASFYEATNQNGEAGKIYAQLVKEDPKGQIAKTAQDRMKDMKSPAAEQK